MFWMSLILPCLIALDPQPLNFATRPGFGSVLTVKVAGIFYSWLKTAEDDLLAYRFWLGCHRSVCAALLITF